MSAGLLVDLPGGLFLVELGRELLGGPLAQGLLQVPARFTARRPGEALGLDRGLALGTDRDLDGFQAPPPTWMVSLMEPSARLCSKTVCPCLWASIRAFSTE